MQSFTSPFPYGDSLCVLGRKACYEVSAERHLNGELWHLVLSRQGQGGGELNRRAPSPAPVFILATDCPPSERTAAQEGSPLPLHPAVRSFPFLSPMSILLGGRKFISCFLGTNTNIVTDDWTCHSGRGRWRERREEEGGGGRDHGWMDGRPRTDNCDTLHRA